MEQELVVVEGEFDQMHSLELFYRPGEKR